MTRLELDATARRYVGGTVLVGGSPLRLLRLSPRGAALVEGWLAGHAVGEDPAATVLARRLLDAGLLHPVPDRAADFDVTVVVPVRDNPGGVARLQAALAGAAKVVVVDDGSAEPVAAATVRHAVSAGPAAARNAGAQLAGTELVAFLDSDVVPERGWLEDLLPLFDDPQVAAAAPRVRAAAGPGVLARYEADRCPLDLGPHPAAVRPLSRVGYVPAAALVVRAKALSQVGGFDETLRYGEDVDLVWRLLDAGWTVRYQPTAVVQHSPRTALRLWLRQRYAYGTSAAALARRHPGRLTPVLLSRTSALAWVLAATGHPALAAAIGALLPRRLRRAGMPANAALTVAVSGHRAAGRTLAEAVRRTWWPLALPSRRGRRILALSLLPCLAQAAQRPGDLGRIRWAALRIADDLAYSAGVWAGCARHRSIRPLLPTFVTRR